MRAHRSIYVSRSETLADVGRSAEGGRDHDCFHSTSGLGGLQYPRSTADGRLQQIVLDVLRVDDDG